LICIDLAQILPFKLFVKSLKNDSTVELIIKDGGKNPDVIVEHLVKNEKQFGKLKPKVLIKL
jgi:hypothetical protein